MSAKKSFRLGKGYHLSQLKGLAKLASIVCPTLVFGAWSLLFASFAGSKILHGETGKQAKNKQHLLTCLLSEKTEVFLI